QFYELMAGIGEISGIVRGWRKTFGVKLQVPENLLGIHGQSSQGDTASRSMKFIEGMAGPAHRAFASHQPNNLHHLRLCRRPAGIQCPPRARTDSFCAYI